MTATHWHAPTLRALIRELEAELAYAEQTAVRLERDFPMAFERWIVVAKRLRQHIRVYRNRATRAERAAKEASNG